MRPLLSILPIFLTFAVPGYAAVNVSSPANNATVNSPVQFVATATAPACAKGVASMGIYVDNKLTYTVQGASLDKALSLSAGKYKTVVEEWDHCGKASYTTIEMTVGSGSGGGGGTATGVTVSSPVNDSSVASPVNYVATATSTCAKGVASMGVYVSNKLIYVVDAASMNTKISMANGVEHTVVEEWDRCGKASYVPIEVTVQSASAPAVSIGASPGTVTPGNSSTLTVAASNDTQVVVTGTDGSSNTLSPSGGVLVVTPASTTTYTAVATGTGGTSASAKTTVTVATKAIASIALSPTPGSIAMGATEQFAATATYNDGSTADITSTANWDIANAAVGTVSSGGLATAIASGSTQISASLSGITGTAPLVVTIAPGTGVNIPMWHVDIGRSGLNPGEQSLTPANVGLKTFGKLFSYLTDGYVYGEPVLASGVTINGNVHNVVYVATEHDSVYAFDADSYGAPLWQVSLLKSGETPTTDSRIEPWLGVTSTPAIDLTSGTIYMVSAQESGGTRTFRLNALDITTGAAKFGGPVTINASLLGTNSDAVDGYIHLTTSCIQRAALLVANGFVYIGFGGCHSGWLLSYDAQTLTQTGVFNSSPNRDGEGTYGGAGGVWMGSGGPVADSAGNIYVTTGNGPWDGQSAWSDSVLKFNSTLQMQDYFTPDNYLFMFCNDADLASGGLMMIPGTSEVVGGGKTGKLYMVNTNNLGHEQANDAGATQTLWFEAALSAPYSTSCTDSTGTHTTEANSFEIFGTAAYFNGSIYLGVTPTSTTAPAGVGRFTYSSGTLTPDEYSAQSVQENTRGTTPFLSANGTTGGIMWMIDTGQPLASPEAPTNATLRAYDANNLADELYNSSQNSGDTPGYGIKFSSPVVANGKVYISTGHDLVTATTVQGEIDVYGLN